LTARDSGYSLADTSRAMASPSDSLQSRLAHLTATCAVEGACVARLLGGAIEVAAAGVRDKESGQRVDAQTVFGAASLSKPMVAYAVMQLADSGVIDLDQPLGEIMAPPVPDDPASAAITMRHLLSHTGGLQNLLGKDPARLYFPPGAWFSYSSLGFTHLQAAVAARTGEPLEATMKRLVFDPLGMRSSSFEWQPRFAANLAIPHEGGKPIAKHMPPAASASYSLQTTAGDYAAFMAAVVRGDRLGAASRRQWLMAHATVPREGVLHLQDSPPVTDPRIAWALGWGVEPEPGTFFQWGKMDGVRAFAMGSISEQAGFVLLTNSNKGLRLMAPLARDILPGDHPAIAWLQGCVSE
jgi:CubicO group peptidase (beta-lactamase class C family)